MPVAVVSTFAGGAASAAGGGLASEVVLGSAVTLVAARAAAADKLVCVLVFWDTDASQAAGGWSARAVSSNPLPTTEEMLLSFLAVSVVADDCPILAFPRRNSGKRDGCCTYWYAEHTGRADLKSQVRA